MKIFAIAVMLAALMATPAAAQQPAGDKIGVVNTQRVLRDSRVSKDMYKSLEADFKKREREIEGGPKADIERRKAALAEDMNVRRQDALQQFIEKTNAAIRRIAVAEKFDIVFFEAAYANARIDLTEKVIKEIDAGK